MYAVIRRWEGVDTSRADEVSRAIKDEFVPMIGELSGYHGYWVVQSDSTIVTFGLFESRAEAEKTTGMAADFLKDHNLQDAMPNAPMVTAGEVIVAGPVHALA
jgi:hypothetical protein